MSESKSSTFPFWFGLLVGISAMGMVFMGYLEYKSTQAIQTEIDNRPRSHVYAATALTKDAVTMNIQVVIRSRLKRDEQTQLDAKHYMRTIIAKYMYVDHKKASHEIYEGIGKYLALPCDSTVMSVSMSLPKGVKLK